MSVIVNEVFERIGIFHGEAEASVSGTQASHSGLTNGAALSPAASFTMTVKSTRPKVRLRGFLPNVCMTGTGVMSWHLMLGSTCYQKSNMGIYIANIGSHVVYDLEEELAAGDYTCSVQLKIIAATGTVSVKTIGEAGNPIQMFAEEVPY